MNTYLKVQSRCGHDAYKWSKAMQIKVLGCGNSVGVPIIGCECYVCKSKNEKNKRSRSSIFIETNETRILVDAGPDFRAQALKNNITKIDGVFFTHVHYDHTASIHELSVLPQSRYESDAAIPVYGDKDTIEYLVNIAGYMFLPRSAGGVSWKQSYAKQNIIDYYNEFYIGKEKLLIFPQKHGRIFCSGIIINDKFAYCTDVETIPERAIEIMRALKLKALIIECFCYRKANAHSNLEIAIDYINSIKPEVAFFTHMTHEIEYDELLSKLGSLNISNVYPAYDGLTLVI